MSVPKLQVRQMVRLIRFTMLDSLGVCLHLYGFMSAHRLRSNSQTQIVTPLCVVLFSLFGVPVQRLERAMWRKCAICPNTPDENACPRC